MDYTKKIRSVKQILSQPVHKVEGTEQSTGYELGRCFQLDRTHCLLVASLDEQGGGDRAVGNDLFVFSSLDQIDPEHAVPLNRADPNYQQKDGNIAFLSKYPANGGVVPVEAISAGSGTGLMVSQCVTICPKNNSITDESEVFFEFLQIAWDGRDIRVTSVVHTTILQGSHLKGMPISSLLYDDDTFLMPMTTDQGIVVFRFAFEYGEWRCIAAGNSFGEGSGICEIGFGGCEVEASLCKSKGRYWIHTRGCDPIGRLYVSEDGMNYRLHCKKPMHTVPQVLNQGLDGELYLSTNPFPTPPGWIRNPLVLIPLGEEKYGEPVIIFDDRGIRVDTGDSIPFVDHAIASNVFLDGRWKHLLFFRRCDLKERTAYGHQTDLARLIGEAIPRRESSGLYVTEIEYDTTVQLTFEY